MIKAEQIKVLKFSDENNYPYIKEKGDDLGFFWNMKTDSFINYINNIEMEEEQREELFNMEEWEMDCTIIDWSDASIIVMGADNKELTIPFDDISRIWN